jgi:glycerophosphoryl diester phosphodiesterase
MKVIAHRGAVKEALENSYTAYDLAVKAGADRLELDVHLTADREIIVMHDHDLNRTAGINCQIADLTRAELQQFNLKNGDPVPFLDEVIDRYLDQIEINIEMKGPDSELGSRVADLLSNHPLREKIILSSFDAEPLLAAKSKSDLALACLLASPATWPLSGLSIPLNFMQHIGARIIHPNTRLLNDNFMDQAVRRGWTVYPYCELENSEEEHDATDLWTSLLSWGVSGLCTNYPREMKLWLEEAHGFKIVHKEAQQQVER